MPFRYRAIAGRLKHSLATGALRPGDRVVSARQLARRESVSVPTAVAALRVLELEGLIVARPRSGYFVCGARPAAPARSTPPERPQPVDLSALIREVYAQDRRIAAPFGAAFPDPEWLPRQALERSLRSSARRIGGDAFTYSSPPGRLDLRRQIALGAAAWGARFGPGDLVVTAGETQAMRVALQVTCRRGDVVAVESPAYFGTLLLLESLGLKALAIPTSPRYGLDVSALAEALDRRRIGAVIACPTAQNPLGCSMSTSAKQALVGLLSRRQVPLIEDDVYGDLDEVEPRSPACKAFDESGNVLYCSSISKTLAPGWRLGWIAAGRYHERALQLRWQESLAGSPLFEAALADFLASGDYRRHLRRFRPKLKAAVRAIAARVEASFPAGTRISRPAAGFLLWIELPPGLDALDVHRRALAEGIGVAPGHLFSPRPRFTHHLRLSCARRVTPALLEAIDRLGSICHG
jgi:DNA-binding transcriptional MocR family regulator